MRLPNQGSLLWQSLSSLRLSPAPCAVASGLRALSADGASSRDPKQIVKEAAAHRFNLDGVTEESPSEEEGRRQSGGASASAAPTPEAHSFRQPARLHEIPEAIRPRFLVPVKKRHDPVGLQQIFSLVKSAAKARFNESVDVSFRLNIDPKNSNQLVRGTVSLPHGTGREKRVAVFARGADAAAALEAGAALVGDDDLVATVAEKKGIDADVVIATPDMMGLLGKVARILGPKGLMPNPKMGTVTTRVRETVLEQRMGKVQFRNDKGGVVSCSIGRIKFDDDVLKENFLGLLGGLLAVRPSTVKGSDVPGFIERVCISSTTGKGFPLATSDLATLGKAALAAANK